MTMNSTKSLMIQHGEMGVAQLTRKAADETAHQLGLAQGLYRVWDMYMYMYIHRYIHTGGASQHEKSGGR